VGKGFSHVVGVTAAGGPEGQSPYGNPSLRIWVPIPPSPPFFAKRKMARSVIRQTMYYLYILINEAKTRTYTGVAEG